MAAMARIDDEPDRIAAVDDIHAVERQSRIHTLGAADADGRHAVIGEHERSQPARIAKVDGAEVVRYRTLRLTIAVGGCSGILLGLTHFGPRRHLAKPWEPQISGHGL